MNNNRTLALVSAISILTYMSATPVEAGHLTGNGISNEISTSSISSANLKQPVLLAWCRAMGGYSSFEEQARAQSKNRQKLRTQMMEDQKALQNLGYYKGKMDGLSGPSTRSAIRDFQRENGLTVNGNLNESNRQLLNSGNAKSMPTQIERKTAAQQLKEDQEVLQKYGYYTGKLDGLPGPATKTAVADFRRTNNLGIGTTLDAKSRSVLYSDKLLPKATKESGDNTQKWITSVNDDGVSVIMITQRKTGYRLRTANGYYDAAGAGEVLAFTEKSLGKGEAQKVYVDVSGLSKKGVASFKDTLSLRPNSTIQLIENDNSRNLIFSRTIEVTKSSPPTQLPTGRWQSIVEFSISKTQKLIVNVIGKTKELTSKVVDRLHAIFSGQASPKSTLAGSLQRMRKDLKKSGDITSDDDLLIQLQSQLGETIELMGIPPCTSVHFAWQR